MSFQEILTRVAVQVEILLPYLILVTVLTAALLPLLLIRGKKIWVDQPSFRWMGIFYSLDLRLSLCMSCAWIKLLLVLGYLIMAKPLDLEQYIIFLIVGVTYTAAMLDPRKLPFRLVWLALQTVALFSCNVLCSYIQDVGAKGMLTVMYIILALFSSLFSAYLFLNELNDISEGRNPKTDETSTQTRA